MSQLMFRRCFSQFGIRIVRHSTPITRSFSFNAFQKLPPIIFFDLETTGISRDDRIIEIAAQDSTGGAMAAMESLVNPRMPIGWRASDITGILDEDVNRCDVPEWNIVGRAFIDFVESRRESSGTEVILAAHNAKSFDIPMLLREFDRCQLSVPSHWQFLDTLLLFRTLFKSSNGLDFGPDAAPWHGSTEPPKKFGLEYLYREYFKLESKGESHRARADVEMLLEVTERVVTRFNVPASYLKTHLLDCEVVTAMVQNRGNSNGKKKTMEAQSYHSSLTSAAHKKFDSGWSRTGVKLQSGDKLAGFSSEERPSSSSVADSVPHSKLVETVDEFQAIDLNHRIVRKELRRPLSQESAPEGSQVDFDAKIGLVRQPEQVRVENSSRGPAGGNKPSRKVKGSVKMEDPWMLKLQKGSSKEAGQSADMASHLAVKRWLALKDRWPDCLTFVHLEGKLRTYYEDSATVSKKLGAPVADTDLLMAEIPASQLDESVCQLLLLGHSVAIGGDEAAEDRILTPGTALPGRLSANNNFVVTLTADSCPSGIRSFGMSYADVATGEFLVREFSAMDQLVEAVALLQPSEIVVSEKDHPFDDVIASWANSPARWFHGTHQVSKPTIFLQGTSGDSFLEDNSSLSAVSRKAASLLLRYLAAIGIMFEAVGQPLVVSHGLAMDRATFSFLQVFPAPGSSGSLFEYLERDCCTAMGSRTLRQWLLSPCVDLAEITKRHSAVERLISDPILRSIMRERLKKVPDLARVVSSVVSERTPLSGRKLSELFGFVDGDCMKSIALLLCDFPSTIAENFKSELMKLSQLLNSEEDNSLSVSDLLAGVLAIQKSLGQLDVLTSFAEMAATRGFTRPQMTENGPIQISEGRNILLELQLPEPQKPTPNSISLSSTNSNQTAANSYTMPAIALICGSHGSGMTTLLQQAGLTSLLAQIGCFLPAKSAILPVIHSIRSCSDHRNREQNLAEVLAHSTAESRSLLLIDDSLFTADKARNVVALASVEHLADASSNVTAMVAVESLYLHAWQPPVGVQVLYMSRKDNLLSVSSRMYRGDAHDIPQWMLMGLPHPVKHRVLDLVTIEPNPTSSVPTQDCEIATDAGGSQESDDMVEVDLDEVWKNVEIALKSRPATQALVMQKGRLLALYDGNYSVLVKVGITRQFLSHFQRQEHYSTLVEAFQQALQQKVELMYELLSDEQQ